MERRCRQERQSARSGRRDKKKIFGAERFRTTAGQNLLDSIHRKSSSNQSTDERKLIVSCGRQDVRFHS